jgi:DHA1 family bicyclomycin/chloramphenicol resistance-like MFS transporter
MGTISPIVSPMIEAIILKSLSWRGVFVVLAIIGLISVIGSIVMEETIEHHSEGSVFKVVGRLGTVMRNKGFMSLLLTFSIINIAFMSYISASSYIYIDGFGLSEKAYSYYFAANAIFFLIGPSAYIALSKRFHYKTIIPAAYIITCISGLLLLSVGTLKPWTFILTLIPASFCGSIMGPPRANLMLEQVQEDIGAASSLMSCAFTFFGSIGMLIISASPVNRVFLLGLLYFIIGIITLIAWFTISKKPFIKHIYYHSDQTE